MKDSKTVIRPFTIPLFGFETFPLSLKTVPTIFDASFTRSRSERSDALFLIIKCASSKYLLPVFYDYHIFVYSLYHIFLRYLLIRLS